MCGEIKFKVQLDGRDKSHFTFIKGTIHPEDIRILSIYSPSRGVLNFIQQMLPDVEFTAPLSPTDTSAQEKENRNNLT